MITYIYVGPPCFLDVKGVANGVWAAQSAFAPRVANEKNFFVSSDEWDVWQCEPPVSNTKHNKFGTNSESSRRQQNALLVRSKRAKFHAIRVSSQCTAEAKQWIGRISENEGPRFVFFPGKVVRCSPAKHATDETTASK